jgi:hypothetical protein
MADADDEKRVADEFDKSPTISVSERPTVALSPRELATIGTSWPLALATLERLGPWATYAFRLGTIALLQSVCRQMAQENAHGADLVNRARTLVEALARMPWEG